MSGETIGAITDELQLGRFQRAIPATAHRAGELGFGQALHRAAPSARVVGMKMRAIIVRASFVAGDTAHVAGHPRQLHFDQLQQVSIERGLIPIVTADR